MVDLFGWLKSFKNAMTPKSRRSHCITVQTIPELGKIRLRASSTDATFNASIVFDNPTPDIPHAVLERYREEFLEYIARLQGLDVVDTKVAVVTDDHGAKLHSMEIYTEVVGE
jgi:hypothetical protein